MKSLRVRQPGLVDREVGHHRHAVVLDLAKAQRPVGAGVVVDERRQHVLPVLRDARRAVLGEMGEENSRSCTSLCASTLPCASSHSTDARQCSALAVRVPAGGVGAAEAVHAAPAPAAGTAVSRHLDVQQDDVDAVEEVQVDVHHLQRDGRVADAWDDAHRGDVWRRKTRIGEPVVASPLLRCARPSP